MMAEGREDQPPPRGVTAPADEELRPARELLKEWTLARFLDRVKREPIVTLSNDTMLCDALRVLSAKRVLSAPVLDYNTGAIVCSWCFFADEASADKLIRVGFLPPSAAAEPCLKASSWAFTASATPCRGSSKARCSLCWAFLLLHHQRNSVVQQRAWLPCPPQASIRSS